MLLNDDWFKNTEELILKQMVPCASLISAQYIRIGMASFLSNFDDTSNGLNLELAVEGD